MDVSDDLRFLLPNAPEMWAPYTFTAMFIFAKIYERNKGEKQFISSVKFVAERPII
jgi:hypothetical protein